MSKPQRHGEPAEPRTSQSGLTLVEVLIATAVFILVSFAVFDLARHFSISTMRTASTLSQRAGAGNLADALEADQQSAEAIFIPITDVLGHDNVTSPHEVDFYAADGAHRRYFWAYYYSAAAHTIQRYNYASPGTTAVPAGSILTNVISFTPSLHAISEVTNASSPIYLPIFASARDYDVPIGAGSNIVAGTHVIHIDLATDVETTPVDLAAAAAPSGFTVVLNYTPAPTPTPASSGMKTWPAFALYGANGTQLSSMPVPRPWNVAMAINAALGGAVAQAAGPCPAQAYTSDSRTGGTVDTNPPAGSGISVQPNGCFDGRIYAYEPGGNASSFNSLAQPSTCGILIQSVTPASASSAFITPSVSSGDGSTCNVMTNDSFNSAQGSAYNGLTLAAVVGTCSPSCDLGPQTLMSGSCQPGPYAQSQSFAVRSGNGTTAVDGFGEWILTRTGPGPISVQQHTFTSTGAETVNRFGVPICTTTFSNTTGATTTYY